MDSVPNFAICVQVLVLTALHVKVLIEILPNLGVFVMMVNSITLTQIQQTVISRVIINVKPVKGDLKIA